MTFPSSPQTFLKNTVFPVKIVTLSPPSFGKSTKLDKNYPFVSYPPTQRLDTVPGVSCGSGGEGAGKTSGGREGLKGDREESLCVEQTLGFAQVRCFLLCFVLTVSKVQPPGVCQFPKSAAGRGGGVVLPGSNKLADFHTC